MAGMVAILGNVDSSKDHGILIDCLRYRGTIREKKVKGKGSIAVLDKLTTHSGESIPVALDGYAVYREDKSVLYGPKGEAILYDLYKKLGTGLLERLEGEFTVILQGENGDYLVARDPVGVKPLYYTLSSGKLYLASEIKALLTIGGEIKEVPPGSYCKNGRDWISYYHIPQGGKDDNLSLEKVEAELIKFLRRSVEEKVNGVDRWGIYLSGGLDSSVVACLAAELSSKPVYTFTVGIAGSQDIKFARKIAQLIGSKHYEYIYTLEEILEVLPEVIHHLESFDCAYVRSSIPNYIAARQAKEMGRHVMLTGEGSDELFAGYSYLKQLESPERINRELSGFLKKLSNTGLQRVDRMNSAHGLECRVPFLKPELINLAVKLPLEWKLKGLGCDPVDKWILRRAFEDKLGEEVSWREKQQFDQGSGSALLLEQVAEQEISDTEYVRESGEAPTPVRNKEELYYYRIFRNYYPEDVVPLVGRWEKTG